MTHDEILNMEAGREMDALIHEFVFVVCAHEWDKINKKLPDDKKGNSKYKCLKCGLVKPAREASGGRNYSTDIAAADEVLTKMENDGWFWEASVDIHSTTHRYTWCFSREKSFVFSASTKSHAISGAALLAVMEDG